MFHRPGRRFLYPVEKGVRCKFRTYFDPSVGFEPADFRLRILCGLPYFDAFGLFSAPWRTRQAGNAYNSSGGLSRLGPVLSRWPRRNSFSERPISVICRSYSRQSGFVSLQVMSPKMGEEPLFEPARWLQNNRSASSRATVRARDDVVCSLIQQRFP